MDTDGRITKWGWNSGEDMRADCRTCFVHSCGETKWPVAAVGKTDIMICDSPQLLEPDYLSLHHRVMSLLQGLFRQKR